MAAAAEVGEAEDEVAEGVELHGKTPIEEKRFIPIGQTTRNNCLCEEREPKHFSESCRHHYAGFLQIAE